MSHLTTASVSLKSTHMEGVGVKENTARLNMTSDSKETLVRMHYVRRTQEPCGKEINI